MPPFPRIICILFLSLPGMILWLGGFVSLLYASAFTFLNPWPDALVATTLSASVASLGFVMFTCGKLLTTEEALRLPLRHLPAMIGFQLAVMISGAVALGSAPVTVGMLIFGGSEIVTPLTAVASASILASLLHLHPSLQEKWKSATEEERLSKGGAPAAASGNDPFTEPPP